MRMFRHFAAGLICLVSLTTAARAESPCSPLRLIPAEANLLIQVKEPRRLVETLTTLKTLRQLMQFPNVKEFLDSTPARRFYQLLAYFEKELGARWPELLDRLAGEGLAVGVKIGVNPAPVLLIIQGKDETLIRKFARLGLDLLEQEVARGETKVATVKGLYRTVETVRIGKEFHLAVAGTAILISNNEKTLHRSLDLHLGREKKSLDRVASIADARRLLPKDPLSSLWLNMESIREIPKARAIYKTPRDDPIQTILFGTILDVLGRTPFVSAGLYHDKGDFLATIRIPRGREGMGPEGPLHLPPSGQPGSRPLLEPRGVLLSDSFYLDLARIWQDRTRLFNEKQVQALEKSDKDTGRFLSGARLSKLFTQAGPYHRFVVVDQPKVGYTITPKQRIPAFAYVVELRDPKVFGDSMTTVLRGAAFFASFQVKLKSVEEQHGDVTILGYRFPENAPLKGDVNDLRFNFSPSFTRVGNQFVFCSTLELCRELVDLLGKEDRSSKTGAPNTEIARIYAAGGAALLDRFKDTITVQTVLDQAVPLKEAQEQVNALIALVRTLGTFSLESRYSDKEFHYDIRLRK